jgi:transposase-like protein
MRDVVRYSEAFKQRLVEDVAGGKYKSLNEASRRNGIRGCATVSKWIKQYGWEDILPKRIKVETMQERDEWQEVRNRIREPEAALDRLVVKERKSIVEHPFGTIKRAMEAGYCLCKGKKKVSGEFALVFLAYNMKRVINILGTKNLLKAFT